MASVEIRYAARGDEEQILALMQRYYAEERYPFHEDRARRALELIFSDLSLGRVWVMATPENLVVGYAVLTLGFSLEYLGRDAFVDELFIAPVWRGKGLGRAALQRVENECRKLDVHVLHLEVEHDKPSARRLYEKVGFEPHDRLLMSKWLIPRRRSR